MKDPIAEGSYTFADYFKMNAEIDDVLAHFGYSFVAKMCTLPSRELDRACLVDVRSRLEESLPYLSLSNETARREFLISPVLLETVRHSHAKLRVEYPLEVNDQLKGTLDYFLRAKHNVLIIEAKNADLQRGFTQLAVELVALDRWFGDEEAEELLYGVVSTGDAWRFGFLEREAQRVTLDLNHYRVPADFEELVGILVAILTD